MPAPSWKVLFRYEPKDSYKNVYDRAYRQIVLAKKLSPSSEPALRKALADAKVYFNAKGKKKPMVMYRNGGKMSNKNVAGFLVAARR